MLTAALLNVQRRLFSPDATTRTVALAALIGAGALTVALLIGVVGPMLALVAGMALVGGALILADTHWGFVALAGVVFGLPFASLPFSIGFKPTFLDAALGALVFVWLLKLAVTQERKFV